MNKKLVVGAVAGCAVVAAVSASKKRPAGPKLTMSNKMRKCMEAMPEDFPPRVMFDNALAARVNTEKILERLGGEEEATPSADDIEVLSPTDQ